MLGPVVRLAQVVAQLGGPDLGAPWRPRAASCPATCSSSRRRCRPGRCASSTGRSRRRPRWTGPARSRDAGRPGPGRRRGCRRSAPRYLVAMAEHSRCQPGRPGPQGVSQDGSPGLAPFHSAKSRGSRLAPAPSVSPAGRMCSSRWPGQAAVVRLGADVEVDVAAGRVGVAGLDQPPHQHDHLGHVPGGPRLDVRRQAAEHVVGAGEGALVPLGHRPPRRRPAAGRCG